MSTDGDHPQNLGSAAVSAKPTPPRVDAAWSVTALAAALAALGLVGADARWMIPLGRVVWHGHLPGSLPYASAPTSGWHDTPALAELVLYGLYSLLGERGLLLLAALAAYGAWSLLGHGLKRQGATAGTAAVLGLLVIVGSLPTLLVTRSYLFSLLLFPALVYLLEEDSRAASRRLWLVAPLLALWSNLHGVALVGWGVLLVYLALERLRRTPLQAVALALVSTLSLCLTATLYDTPAYYWNALHNVAAKRGQGLWQPLTLHGFGLELAVVAVILLVFAVLGRPQRWEWLALLLLAAGTVQAARIGPWLLFLACYPAARRMRLPSPRPRLSQAVFLVFLTVAVLALVKRPLDPGSMPLARQAAKSGQPVLAEGLLAEQVELLGGTVWVANPIDAFRRPDQALYLDWLDGDRGGGQAVLRARLVLVSTKSKPGRAAARDRRLALVARRGQYALYRRRR